MCIVALLRVLVFSLVVGRRSSSGLMRGGFVQAGTAPLSAGRCCGFAATIARPGAGALAYLLAVTGVFVMAFGPFGGGAAGLTVSGVGFGHRVVATAFAYACYALCLAMLVVVILPCLAMFGAPD